MSELDKPKKYYEYYYTWSMAESMRKQHVRNGRNACEEPSLNRTTDKKKWVIWYNREGDTRREHTSNARYYDK